MTRLEKLRKRLGQCDEILLDAILMRHHIIKDIMDKKTSDNFDDTWDDDLDEDFDDMFDDVDSEDVTSTREYVKMDPSKMSAESCEE